MLAGWTGCTALLSPREMLGWTEPVPDPGLDSSMRLVSAGSDSESSLKTHAETHAKEHDAQRDPRMRKLHAARKTRHATKHKPRTFNCMHTYTYIHFTSGREYNFTRKRRAL